MVSNDVIRKKNAFRCPIFICLNYWPLSHAPCNILPLYNGFEFLLFIDIAARDILIDAKQLSKVFKKTRMETCNAVIAYRDRSLNPGKLIGLPLLDYPGKLKVYEQVQQKNLARHINY